MTIAIEELAGLVEAMRTRGERGDGLKVMENAITELNVILGDMLACMESDDEGSEAEAIATALSTALKGISFPITVNVSPTPITVQPAQVNVAAPNVTVQAPVQTVTGWVLTVKSRDGNGAIRELSFKPEN